MPNYIEGAEGNDNTIPRNVEMITGRAHPSGLVIALQLLHLIRAIDARGRAMHYNILYIHIRVVVFNGV